MTGLLSLDFWAQRWWRRCWCCRFTSQLADDPFWLTLFTRVVILSMAAVSLNLILGYGGMVSFGHAVFRLGGYAVGIPAFDGIGSGFCIAVALVAGALFGAVTGAVSLRTRGVHFIMITMAFAQMVYFAIVSLRYGGDDGLVINVRSEFFPAINLGTTWSCSCLLVSLLLFSLPGVQARSFALRLRHPGGKGQ